MPALNPLMAGGLKKYRPVQTKAVAAKMLQLALNGPEGRGVHHF